MKNVIDLLADNTRAGKISDNTVVRLALAAGVSQKDMGGVLKELEKDGKIVRIQGKPLHYADCAALQQITTRQVPDKFSSISEYQDWLAEDLADPLDSLIGADGSLYMAVENTRSAISYPPKGLSILYTGETGTGKSLMARLAFQYGQKTGRFSSDAAFVQVNCSEYTNNPELLTANLFGYKKGAFTGADADNPGLLQSANGGVLFLDEVHALAPECQEKLFLFLDNGTYRMLGDNQTLLSSDALVLFATTEDPEKVLLKTLLRRIPVRIELPSLKKRDLKEKSELLLAALKAESQVIGREVEITSAAWNALFNYEYPANVGDLKNMVKLACMNALFKSKPGQPVQIHTLMLPEPVLTSWDASRIPFYPGEILDFTEIHAKLERVGRRQELLREVIELVQSARPDRDRICESQKLIGQFCQDQWPRIYERSLSDQHKLKKITQTVMTVLKKYGYTPGQAGCEELSYLLFYGMDSPLEIDEIPDKESFIRWVEKTLEQEWSVAQEITERIGASFDFRYHPVVGALLALYIECQPMADSAATRAALIICHGESTASSMAEAVNTLLQDDVFDAIDMPLDTTTAEIIHAIQTYLLRKNTYRDLTLLVDMGSLEQIYKSIRVHSSASLAVANHVNTQLALSVGSRLQGGEGLYEIFKECQTYMESNYRILDRSKKELALLCSCSTGIDTADKLKQILEDSLPEDSGIKVLSYDYLDLLQEGMKCSFFDRYEILAIAGTMDPGLSEIPFIALEQLISQEAVPVLRSVLGQVMEPAKLEQFSENILRNFSLNNVIGALTILNPVKLLDCVETAIANLSAACGRSFTNQMKLGLYVHVSCLIERLVTGQGTEDYELDPDQEDEQAKQFYGWLKQSFAQLEKFYHVSVPIEESEYIRSYIQVKSREQQ